MAQQSQQLALPHTVSLPVLFKYFQVDAEQGLMSAAVERRREQYGANVLPRKEKTPWWRLLVRQFQSPLVYILVIAGAATWWMNEIVDTVMIFAAVGVSVAVGFWQEYRAGDILESLRTIVRVTARVLRDGHLAVIDAEELVVGDIIALQEGMKVPADARLLQARNLEVDEAVLTGESSPIHKEVGVTAKNTPVADRTNMVHMGTVATRGEGQAIVVATGTRTAIGTIAELTQKTDDTRTPLQERLADLGGLLTWVVLAAGVIIVVVGMLEGHTALEMFTTAVAVAIGAIPEGLPAALSIVLAVAMQRVLRRKGLVQSLMASETLGSVSVICADKTGTLTEGTMRLENLFPHRDTTDAQLLEVLALANEAELIRVPVGEQASPRPSGVPKGKRIRGEPTDIAKLEAFFAAAGNLDQLLWQKPRTALLRFDSERKFLASFHQLSDHREQVFISGAPEVLLEHTHDIDDSERARIIAKTEELASEGFRVIAAAIVEQSLVLATASERTDDELASAIEKSTFMGLAALRDPIRNDVAKTMHMVREAGVKVVMITGDHVLTATAIGKELGFVTDSEVLLAGEQLDEMSDTELMRQMETVEVIARVTPHHKMRIVAALQARGASVAMTGDGVNDAPALKAADIGVAVGSATDVTKTAADLVLLDSSFTTIVAAIREGRVAFDNIRKISIFLLADTMTEVLLVMTALILRVPIPLTAVQILWINFVKDIPPALALAFEPGEEDVMQRPPLSRRAPILDTIGKRLTLSIGLVSNVTLLGIYLFFLFTSSFSLEYLRTLVFAGVGVNALVYVFALKNVHAPLFRTNLLNNKSLIWASVAGFGLMLIAIVPEIAHRFLETRSLQIHHALVVMGLFPLLQLGVIELIKYGLHRRSTTETGERVDTVVGEKVGA